jgi:hypothetical protein
MSQFDGMGITTPDHDLEALRKLCQKAHKNFRLCRHFPAVEVGSWAGRTALVMSEAMPERPILCVDTWLGSATDITGHLSDKYGQINVFNAFCRNVGPKLFQQIFPFVGSSAQAARVAGADPKFALVFIDGEHTYDACKADIAAWRPLVRHGGILCGHDYGKMFPGVPRAVDEAGGRVIPGTTIWFMEL